MNAGESLFDLFARQDAAVNRNAAALGNVLPLLAQTLGTAFEMTIEINSSTVLGDALPPRRIIANLLHAAVSGLVTSTRLVLFGDHVGAITLVRLAFEDTYHAEFFRRRPDLAMEWDASGRIVDFDTRRLAMSRFPGKHDVRKVLEAHDDPEHTRTRLFHELSTYGSHTNPATTAMRLALDSIAGSNLGFVSVGKVEATLLAGIHTLHVGNYALSEMCDSFRDLIADGLAVRSAQLVQEYRTMQSSLPAELSLMR